MAPSKKMPKGTYFFISLEARLKGPVFRDAFFKTRIERRWTEVVAAFPKVNRKEYMVNDRLLHALLYMRSDLKVPETILTQLLDQFKQKTALDWKRSGELWLEEVKIRRIENMEELRSIRGFIVHKMLGGKAEFPIDEEDDDVRND